MGWRRDKNQCLLNRKNGVITSGGNYFTFSSRKGKWERGVVNGKQIINDTNKKDGG